MSPGIILVIDDDECILNLTKAILVNAGYEVRTSTNSIEANRYIFCPTPPSLIIIDYMMPLASGDNKINLLKSTESTKQIPVILMSGKSESELLSITLRSGADAYILKPFTQQRLVDVVNSTLRNATVQTKQLSTIVPSIGNDSGQI